MSNQFNLLKNINFAKAQVWYLCLLFANVISQLVQFLHCQILFFSSTERENKQIWRPSEAAEVRKFGLRNVK